MRCAALADDGRRASAADAAADVPADPQGLGRGVRVYRQEQHPFGAVIWRDIRVIDAGIGHDPAAPVLGDQAYGDNTALRGRLHDAEREYVLSVGAASTVFAPETVFAVAEQTGSKGRPKSPRPDREPEAPPVDATLTRVDYDLRIDGDLAAGRASLTVDVLKDGWVRVPIPAGLLVREAKLDGKLVSLVPGVAGKGNDGVTALIKQTPGGIGYVEFGYAKNNKLTFAALQNKAGEFVVATTASGAVTLATTKFPANLLRAWPSDPDGKDVYPIATFTWLLLYKKYDNTPTAEAVKKFVNFGLTDGQKFAEELGYIPLPKEVVDKDLEALKSVE